MTKTLELVFRDSAAKEVVISLADPRDGLTLAEVQPVMQDILTKNIFDSKGLDLVQIVEARIRTKDTIALA